ncbi:MAG: hypothetical protein ACR2HX_02255 [Pyrinomonadaceae bacterium]
MRILLDEGVPRIIQKRLNQFSISSVDEMGWKAVENGALLDLMAATFQILITTDKNIAYQQNLKKRGISVILLPTNRIPLVIELLPKVEEAISTVRVGESREISIAS